jgi:hypothetical protein
VAAHAWADAELAAGAAFMERRGLVHFDAHFRNVLTDGRLLYFSDFGLALSSRFELTARESAFLARHRGYDRAYTAAHLVRHHLAPRLGSAVDHDRLVRDWAAGDRVQGVPAEAAELLTRHARTTVLLDGFHRRLCEESKETPYPAEQLRAEAERSSRRGPSGAPHSG